MEVFNANKQYAQYIIINYSYCSKTITVKHHSTITLTNTLVTSVDSESKAEVA